MRQHNEKRVNKVREKLYTSIPVQPTDGCPDPYQLKFIFFLVLKKEDHDIIWTKKESIL